MTNLNFSRILFLVSTNRDCGKVLNDTLCVHSLSSTRLSTGDEKKKLRILHTLKTCHSEDQNRRLRDQDGLVLPVCSSKKSNMNNLCRLNFYLNKHLFYKSLNHTTKHELISVVRHREDVGWSLHTLLASVGSHNLLVVHWQPLVGVYSGTEEPRVGLKNNTAVFIQYLVLNTVLWINKCVLRRSSMLHNAL